MPADRERKAVRYVVSGKVQGVYFRASAAGEARRLGIAGWARNLPDGRVEVVAVGDEQALADLATWLWRGPPSAVVAGVKVEVFEAGVAGPDFVVL